MLCFDFDSVSAARKNEKSFVGMKQLRYTTVTIPESRLRVGTRKTHQLTTSTNSKNSF